MEHTKISDVLLKVILDCEGGLFFIAEIDKNIGIKNGGLTLHTHTPTHTFILLQKLMDRKYQQSL